MAAGDFSATQSLSAVSQSAAGKAVASISSRLFPTRLNSSDKGTNIALSPDGLEALKISSTAFASVRSNDSRLSGKFYYESVYTEFNSTVLSFIIAGYANSSASLNSYVGADANGIGLLSNGDVYKNGVNTTVFSALAEGDTVGHAIDLNASLYWVRVNGGNWNNNPSADPSTGAGGITVPANFSSRGIFICVAVQTQGDQFDVRPAANFRNPPPSGYSPFGNSELAQTLDAVGQTATVSRVADRSLVAGQTLGGVAQISALAGTVALSAAQQVSGVSQAAASAVLTKAASGQSTAGVAQSATASAALASVAAAQTLSGVSQSSAVSRIALLIASQAAATVSEVAAAQLLARVSGSQTLAAAAQIAVLAARPAGIAFQMLNGVEQVAALYAPDFPSITAAQVLAGIEQFARAGHAFSFERNERTLVVRAERRGYVVAGEIRLNAAAPESRTVAHPGERRSFAFTD